MKIVFSTSLFSVCLSLTSLHANLPTDNPLQTHYTTDEGYPAWTDHIQWDQAIDMSAYGNPADSEFEKFEAARDELHSIGGGVLYYPAGVYDFSDAPMDGPNGRGLMLKSGVVIRGEAPTSDTDASDGTYTLGTRFDFGFTTRTGTGVTPVGETPRDWNLIGLEPDTANGETLSEVANVGIVHVHLVGASVFWGFELDWSGTTTYAASGAWKASLVKPAWQSRIANGQFPLDYFAGSGSSRSYLGAGPGRLIFGCILQDSAPINDVYREGRADPKNFGDTGYFLQKFGARIQVYGSKVCIANNLLPKSTRGFLYRQTVGNNPTQSTNPSSWTNIEATVYYNYNYVTGIDLNKELLNPYVDKNAGYFLKHAIVRDNFIYNHGRKGYNLSAEWAEIRNNTNQRVFLGSTVPSGSGAASGQSYYATLDGYVQLKPGGPGDISDSLSRAFDLAGGPLWIHDNKYGGSYGSTDSMGNDGEGILCQAHGGTQLVSWAVTYNNGQSGYMAGYDVSHSGSLFGWNTTTGSTGNQKAGNMFDSAIVGNLGGSTSVTGTEPVLISNPGNPTNAPTNVSATVVDDYVEISWTDNSTKETGFRVERSVDAGPWAVVAYRPRREAAVSGNPAAWHDSSAPRGLSLSYRIRPTNWTDDGTVVSAESAPVTIPSLAPTTRVAVDPSALTPQDAAWESGFQTRVEQLVNAQTWSISGGEGDPDVGKLDGPALLGEMWKDRASDSSLQSWIDGKGMELINSSYSGSFYKAFSVPGYNMFYFTFEDYSPTVGLSTTQESQAQNINWSYLTREDNRMDPIYGQTEFNSENFNWMARLGGLQWAFELPDTNLGTYAYNWQAGQPKGMSRDYFRGYMDNWTRALFNAGRVEWNAIIYWGYTFNPILALYEHPPVDPDDATYEDKVRKQARAGADWMVLESALHYLDGFTGGPGSRDKNTPYRPFNGSTWEFAYLYFAEDGHMPSYDTATMQSKMDRNMVGWFPWSSYRPLDVVKSIAQRDFDLPVEIQSAKPFYHLDHDNYASWSGEGSYAQWKAAKSVEEQAHRTGFRYEFETIYMDTNYLLASLATYRPNGSLGTFSEQTLFRLLVEGSDNGAVQIFGNTGASAYPSRRDPYEQIGQYGNVMMRVSKNPSATNNDFWFGIPTPATRVTSGNRLFVDMGNGVYFAVLPLGSPTLTNAAYTIDSTVDYQKYNWDYGSGELSAVIMEVGTVADHGSFANFQAAFASLDVNSPANNEVEYTATSGKHLRMQWTGIVNDYPMTENGGYTLSTGGIIPRTWRDGVEVDYENWNAYETVQGEEIVYQEWGSGLLRMAAGGEAVEIEVDPVTAAVTYYTAPLVSDLPTIGIEGIDTVGAESPVDSMLFRLSRTGSTILPLDISLSFSGDANLSDYTLSPDVSAGTATIAAGESTLDILVTPVNDGIEEAEETVNLTVLSAAAYRRSSPPSASGVITGFPVVSVSGFANASEAGSNGSVTVTRTGATGSPLAVDFSLSGSATPDSDYTIIGATTFIPGSGTGSITIPAGQSNAVLTINPVNDSDLEGDESVAFELLDSLGYVPGATTTASINIADDEVPPEPTYLAEKFDAERGPFDLANKRLTLDWNGFGYTGFVEDITEFENDISGTGSLLNLDNDDHTSVYLSGGKTLPFHGSDYASFFVSSNGCISFDSGESGNYNVISYHFVRTRISLLFVNLRIENGGQIRWQQFSDRVIVQYQDVLDYSTGSPNTCQVEMFFDGRVRMSWLTINSPYPLVGLSNGSYNSGTFEQTDFSALPGPPLPPMEAWQSLYFSEAEIIAGLADWNMDAENSPDGLINLLEYAFNLNPRIADAHLAAMDPVVAENGSTPVFTIRIRRNPDASDLNFSLEAMRPHLDTQWLPETPHWEGQSGLSDADGTPFYEYQTEMNGDSVLYRVIIMEE
jgi:hypothetical protein